MDIFCFLYIFSNQPEATKLLIDAGVDVNTKDVKENTALMIAGAVGHYDVLKLLANHPQTDLQAMVGCWPCAACIFKMYPSIQTCTCTSVVI